MRITDVDPIELDLYFERFLNLYRANPPDFDIDFSWTTATTWWRTCSSASQRGLARAYNTFNTARLCGAGQGHGVAQTRNRRPCAGKFNPNRLGEMETVVLKYAAVIRDFPAA